MFRAQLQFRASPLYYDFVTNRSVRRHWSRPPAPRVGLRRHRGSYPWSNRAHNRSKPVPRRILPGTDRRGDFALCASDPHGFGVGPKSVLTEKAAFAAQAASAGYRAEIGCSAVTVGRNGLPGNLQIIQCDGACVPAGIALRRRILELECDIVIRVQSDQQCLRLIIGKRVVDQ